MNDRKWKTMAIHAHSAPSNADGMTAMLHNHAEEVGAKALSNFRASCLKARKRVQRVRMEVNGEDRKVMVRVARAALKHVIKRGKSFFFQGAMPRCRCSFLGRRIPGSHG